MKLKRILIALCRVILGGMFLFSGFVKGVDPMGSAIKIGEYFNAYGLGFLCGSEIFFSILQSTGEMLLGFMLLFGIWTRLSSTLTAIAMVGFSALTLHIALTNPVADCGCFGDAVKLTNWQTFYKNAVVLLPLSIIVAVNSWMTPRRRESGWNYFWVAAFAACAAGMSVYALRHLPLMDFLPYKVGVNIPASLGPGLPVAQEDETKVVYRDKTTGKEQTFTLSDTTWYDQSRWEYVDTIVAGTTPGKPSAGNFALLDQGRDVTLELLDQPGTLHILCITDPASLTRPTADALGSVAGAAHTAGERVIAVTPAPLDQGAQITFDNQSPVNFYNIDDVTLKSLLRARNGVVTLDEGTITLKVNARDIKKAK